MSTSPFQAQSMDDPPPPEPQAGPSTPPAPDSPPAADMEAEIEAQEGAGEGTQAPAIEPATEAADETGRAEVAEGDADEKSTDDSAEVAEGEAGEQAATPPTEAGWESLAQLGLPLAVSDELLNLLVVSRGLLELTGYEARELLGVPAAVLLDEPSQELLFDRVQELAERDNEQLRAAGLKVSLVGREGEPQPALLSLLRLFTHDPSRYLLLFGPAEDEAPPPATLSQLDMGPLPVAMVLVDIEGRVSYLNGAAAKLLEFDDPETALGRSLATLVVDPGDLGPMQRLLEAKGEVVAYQIRLLTHTGNQLVSELTAGALKDAAGAPAGFLALLKDMTEEVLRASEDTQTASLHRQLVMGAPIGLATVDSDHRLMEVNPALSKLTGYPAQRLVTMRLEELIQPALADRLEGELDRLLILSSSPPVTLEAEGLREDGSSLPLTIHLAPLPRGYGGLAVFQDATGHRTAIEQIKTLEERYRELFENYDQTMVLADDDGYVVDANRVACEIFGLTKEEVVGRHIDEVLDQLGGTERRQALSGARPDEMVATGLPLILTEEHRQLLEQLLREEKMAALGHLVAGVAHHINNPLAFVRANTNNLPEYLDSLEELLKAYGALAETAAKLEDPALAKALAQVTQVSFEVEPESLLEQLRKQVRTNLEGLERIGSVTAKLRAYAQPEMGPDQPVDIPEGLRLALELVGPHFSPKVKIVEKLEAVPTTLGQPTLLNQAFQALLVNAAQAVGDKGRVQVGCRQEGEELVVEVADDGPGMGQRLQRNIFNPLFTTRHEGVGLGLCVAHMVVQLHNGSLKVDSEVGKGTTFIVRLPIRTPSDGQSSG